ncbi:hypothetical protein [Fusibacter ferrireducens]|uniref:Flagellar hook-length control protein-like C-terminal domain-containing protein n=1 Tax=Fusibacter ferrireducens TaxID=2785058 RepID=A0ABR9ZMM6_9FIRM|nr:hypothetical protein [Fusibacter ferrireducens]MBF4691712.1 hypothetical protein [Fusibacter ferrireducens]
MRITQNQIVNVPTSIESTKSEQGKALIGKTIEGVVTAINGNKITLSQNGQTLNLINDSSVAFQTNQKVQLLVTGSNEGTLTAVPVNSTVQEDRSGQILDKIGVLVDGANREIAEAMIKYDVPLTKENFNTMKQNLMAAKAFVNDLKMAPDKAALIDVGKTLKENVVNFIKSEALSSESTQTARGSVNPEISISNGENANSALEQMTDKGDALPFAKPETADGIKASVSGANADKNTTANANQVIQEGLAQTLSTNENQTTQTVDTSKIQDAVVKALMKDLVNALGDEPVEAFHEVANKLVDLFNLEDDAAFTKHNLELNLTNLLVMNQLKFTEKSVGNSFFELSKVIANSKLTEEDLLTLQALLQEDIDEAEKLNKVAHFLKGISKDIDAKEKIDKEVLFIKDASQMTKQLNEPLFYMQVPFKLEDYERPVDIYYKRKKAGDDKDEFTILIALKTKNYQEVKCVVEKKKEQFILNFKLASDAIKTVFESRAETLKNQLSEKSIILKFSSQQVEDVAFFDTVKQGSIDIKV